MTGARICVKELYETKYDPLSISYTVLSGTNLNEITFHVSVTANYSQLTK